MNAILNNDRIVFDVETLKLSQDLPNGWNDLHLMGVGVCEVYSYNADRVFLYGEEDVARLRARLEAAREVIGFNSWGFDLPVVYGIDKPTWLNPAVGSRAYKIRHHFASRTNDLLRRVWRGVGSDPDSPGPKKRGCSLRDLSIATLERDKIDTGSNAPGKLAAGRWAEVSTYCIDDVFLTRDLERFIDDNGYCHSVKMRNRIEPAEAFDESLQKIVNSYEPEPAKAET
jgi:hypothetical protein